MRGPAALGAPVCKVTGAYLKVNLEENSKMSALEESVEFVINTQPRCACVLILDTSGSMAGKRIDALNAGLKTFRDELVADPVASQRVEVAIVEFNTRARVVQDFVTSDEFFPPTLKANGSTDMAGGVNEALDLLQRRKRQYSSNGVAYYRPWAFLITDGEISNPDQIAQRVGEEERKDGVTFFAVGVESANEESLRNLSSVRPHKMLSGLKFQELFLWLSASLKAVSKTRPGDMVPVDKTGTWELV
jgi:uncharacterized protein YegL